MLAHDADLGFSAKGLATVGSHRRGVATTTIGVVASVFCMGRRARNVDRRLAFLPGRTRSSEPPAAAPNQLLCVVCCCCCVRAIAQSQNWRLRRNSRRADDPPP